MQPTAAHSYMAISVRGGGIIPEKSSHCSPLQCILTWQFQSGVYFLKSPPIAAHCSPLLHGNFSQGVILEKFSHCSPLQPTLTCQFQSVGIIPEKSSHCSPLQRILTWQFQSGVYFLKSPPIAAHCSPFLHCNFSQGLIPQKSSHCSPTLTSFHPSEQINPSLLHLLPPPPIAVLSYMAISIGGVIPEKSSHCSPLQPTLAWQFQSGGTSSKVLPLQPNSYIILPL